jgi:hypothetical protein
LGFSKTGFSSALYDGDDLSTAGKLMTSESLGGASPSSFKGYWYLSEAEAVACSDDSFSADDELGRIATFWNTGRIPGTFRPRRAKVAILFPTEIMLPVKEVAYKLIYNNAHELGEINYVDYGTEQISFSLNL